MQFEIGMSTKRYLPASGTAGFARSFVSGNNLVPCPPPMITESTLLVFTDCLPVCDIKSLFADACDKYRTGAQRLASRFQNYRTSTRAECTVNRCKFGLRDKEGLIGLCCRAGAILEDCFPFGNMKSLEPSDEFRESVGSGGQGFGAALDGDRKGA